jgi:hypothetical protein
MFITKKMMGDMFCLPQSGFMKLLTKPQKEKEKEKEVTMYKIFVSIEALISREGWKVSLLKGMYLIRMPTLILKNWLDGNIFTYVAKKLTSHVVIIEQRIQIN